MALINILAKSEKEINWSTFLMDYSNLKVFSLEVFPIPKELGFDSDSIGINVHTGYTDREIVLSELERLITFFGSGSYGLKFIELYYGVEVVSENVTAVLSKLLPN